MFFFSFLSYPSVSLIRYRFRVHLRRYVIRRDTCKLNANKLKRPGTVARQIRHALERSPETATFVHDFAAICNDIVHLLSVLIVVSSVFLSERKGSRGRERIRATFPPPRPPSEEAAKLSVLLS